MNPTQMQNQFLHEENLDNYTHHSILELLLTTAGIKGDIPAIVNDLFDAFGSLKAILEARPEQLLSVPSISKRTATMISLITPMFKVWERCNMQNPGILDSLPEAEAYCKSLLVGERNEYFYAIALDNKCVILGVRRISEGTLTEVNAYPRKIVETALNYNAHAIILCHNHPGRCNQPSKEDIETTRNIKSLLNGLGILLLDHIIVCGSNTYSMALHQDINNEEPTDDPENNPKVNKKKKAGKKKKAA